MGAITEYIENHTSILIALSAGLTALVTLWKYIKKPFLWIHKAIKAVNKIETLDSHFKTNGGSTPLDKLNKIGEQINDIHVKVFKLHHRQNFFLDDEDFGYFECDLEGNNTYVNKTYARELKTTIDQLENKNWVNFINDENYEEKWRNAFKDQRSFESDVTFKDGEGKNIKARVKAKEVRTGDGLIGYIGIITFQKN